jgi:hypothetical protein
MLRYGGKTHNEPVWSRPHRRRSASGLPDHRPARNILRGPGGRIIRRTHPMDSLPRRTRPARWLLAIPLFYAAFGPGEPARGQTSPPRREPSTPSTKRREPGEPARGAKEDAKARNRKAQAPAAGKAQEPRREPSEAFKQSIRQTLEKRRQRRARRAGARGLDEIRPVGAIVPWPMPPALIIRQTPDVHGEVNSLLGPLRRSMH